MVSLISCGLQKVPTLLAPAGHVGPADRARPERVRYLRERRARRMEPRGHLGGTARRAVRAICPGPTARAFDDFFWAEVNSRLATRTSRRSSIACGQLTAPTVSTSTAVSAPRWSAATLLQLEEPLRVDDEAAALIHFLSLSRHIARPRSTGSATATIWASTSLPSWPGCAFLLLIRSPSDSAESFLARDAFWAALLGR